MEAVLPCEAREVGEQAGERGCAGGCGVVRLRMRTRDLLVNRRRSRRKEHGDKGDDEGPSARPAGEHARDLPGMRGRVARLRSRFAVASVLLEDCRALGPCAGEDEEGVRDTGEGNDQCGYGDGNEHLRPGPGASYADLPLNSSPD